MLDSAKKLQIIQIPVCIDERGDISFLELGKEIDFPINRVYYISKVPKNSTRGHHAHKKLKQLMIAINGSFDVIMHDGKNEQRFHLNSSTQALYIPSGNYRILENFSDDAICLVCASEIYDADDYIFDFEDFIRWKSEILTS